MTAMALSDLLPDFGNAKGRLEANLGPAVPRQGQQAAPQADISTLIAEAVAEAETALETRLSLAHKAELKEVYQANADEAKVFMETLGDDIGKTLTARLEATQTEIVRIVGSATARTIGGVLSTELQARSLAALERVVREVVADTQTVRIRVQGPLSLFEPLKTSLGPRADHLEFTEAPGFDLTVAINDVVFETRMTEWSTALTEIMS